MQVHAEPTVRYNRPSAVTRIHRVSEWPRVRERLGESVKETGSTEWRSEDVATRR